MFLSDHPPPHFHAYYESSVAVVTIETGEITVGRLPPRIARFVEQWRKQYTAELMWIWDISGTRRDGLAGPYSRSG